jgi:MoaA/NifB/PqqE/SkfB family radical SAM enzyme
MQIHPTRRCNLRCLHCYSSSGPQERDDLPVALLREAISDAQVEDYNVIGISGGEPVLYKPLRALLEHAHGCGMRTTVTSNGMLLDRRRLADLQGAVDVLAISLDGLPQSHNDLRSSPRAFEVMSKRLDDVRQSGIPFGFIFTLTLHNLHELQWVAEFAVQQGAQLLQIHPLEIAGRAGEGMRTSRPDDTEAAYAYLEASRIQRQFEGRIQVQLDFIDRHASGSEPCRLLAGQECDSAPPPLAYIVSPLVIESDGTVVPVQYGFARQYALGNLKDRRLRELAERWRCNRASAFRTLCRRVFEQITAPAELPFVNWYEMLSYDAQRDVSGRPRRPFPV